MDIRSFPWLLRKGRGTEEVSIPADWKSFNFCIWINEDAKVFLSGASTGSFLTGALQAQRDRDTAHCLEETPLLRVHPQPHLNIPELLRWRACSNQHGGEQAGVQKHTALGETRMNKKWIASLQTTVTTVITAFHKKSISAQTPCNKMDREMLRIYRKGRSQRTYTYDPWTWNKVGWIAGWKGGTGFRGANGKNWNNCNTIINKIYFKNFFKVLK